jgi:hypothetical protein
VPVGLVEPRSKQPVTVTDRDELCELRVCEVDVCDGGGFCALTTATTPNAMAAHVPDHICTFMMPPCGFAISADRGATVRPEAARPQIMSNQGNSRRVDTLEKWQCKKSMLRSYGLFI